MMMDPPHGQYRMPPKGKPSSSYFKKEKVARKQELDLHAEPQKISINLNHKERVLEERDVNRYKLTHVHNSYSKKKTPSKENKRKQKTSCHNPSCGCAEELAKARLKIEHLEKKMKILKDENSVLKSLILTLRF